MLILRKCYERVSYYQDEMIYWLSIIAAFRYNDNILMFNFIFDISCMIKMLARVSGCIMEIKVIFTEDGLLMK
jgi:hypothetical protein